MLLLSVLALNTVGGCSGGSSPPERHEPAKAAGLAMEKYDTDGDGAIAEQELQSSPGLEAAMERIDTNRNGKLTSGEIASRLQAYQTHSNFTPIMIRLHSGPHPVELATVTFTPESFMGESLQEFSGVSDSTGNVYVAGKERSTPGLPVGLYTVTIRRDGGEVTTHGVEIADDVPSVGRLVFSL